MNETALTLMAEVNAVQVYTDGGMGPLLGKIEEEVKKFVPDLSTAKGRKEVASLAHKVAQSKTHLDKLGKELTANWKKQAKVVDTERKAMRDRLDALKEEVRQPLTEWENAEKSRKEALDRRVEEIKWIFTACDADGLYRDVAILKEGLAKLQAVVVDESFGDRINDAALEKERAIAAAEKVIAEREEHEQQRAELARLRKEAEEQKQRKRDEAIRREAEEKARRDAEKEAQKERARVEAERLAAEERAHKEKARAELEKAEVERKAREEVERLEREKVEVEKAKQAALKAAEEKRLTDIKEAEEKAELEKREIIQQQERKARVERERKEAEVAAERKRQANVAHRKVIDNNILLSLGSLGCDEKTAIKIVAAMTKKQIPHVEVIY